MLNTVFWLQFEKKNLGNQRKTRDILSHGLRTPRETFFQKNQNFWAWALGRQIAMYLVIYIRCDDQPNIYNLDG